MRPRTDSGKMLMAVLLVICALLLMVVALMAAGVL